MAEGYLAWLQWYKKPSYIDIKKFASKVSIENPLQEEPISGVRKSSNGSSRLSLRRILNNQTCSPMSLHDFYMYLKYIEHSSENLEFYIWFKDYQSRYTRSSALLLTIEQPKLKEQISEDISDSSSTGSTLNMINEYQEVTAKVLSKQEIAQEQYDETILNIESLLTLDTLCSKNTNTDNLMNRFAKSVTHKWSHTNESEDRAASTTSLEHMEASYHRELVTVTSLFLTPESTRELNIPQEMREKILKNITTSSSPRHLEEVANHCYLLLESCSHGNFVRLGVSNGTFETLCMATIMGIILTVGAFLCVLLLAFASPGKHPYSRWEVLCIWPLWCVGTGFLLSSLRGSCFFFLLFSRRQPLPWERFEDDGSAGSPATGVKAFVFKLNLFDRKLKVKDSGLRNLQRHIVLQSLVGGAVVATLMVILFIALPIWG